MELTSPSSADMWSPTQNPKHLSHIAGKRLDLISCFYGMVHQTIMKLEGISRTAGGIQCRYNTTAIMEKTKKIFF